MSDYTGSSFISQPVEEELTGLQTLINENKDANSATQAALDQEIYDRGSADNNLQNQINGSATSSALSAEINTRASADLALDVRISNNVDSIGTLTANLSQEIADRIAGDNNLQNQINPLATQTSLNNEINTRTADDLALGVRITDNTDAIGTTNANLSQEIADRQSADTGLQNQINGLATQASLTAETNARIAADTTLSSSIATNTTAIATTNTNLTQEIADRQSADNNLQADINDRALTLSLNNEITARTAADTQLQTNINFEASQRSYYISNLQGQITTNGTAITTEATARTNADAGLQTSITVNATAIATKANDADVVKLTGDQNIAGSKTFIHETYVKGDLLLADDEARLIFGTNYDRKIYRTDDGLSTNHAFQAPRYDVAGQQIASSNLADGSTLVKLLDGTVAIDGDVNLSPDKVYKINNVTIPTHADLDLKAPIADASLTGNTQMTRLIVNHSDSATIGLDFNNTNNNQYAGKFNTAAYGWRFFNDNTSLASNTTFSVNTKGSGATQTPLLVKNDGKLYTLDQEVDGDINLSAGHEYKINNVSIPTNADLALKAPIADADLTGHTQMERLSVNHSDGASIGLVFNNTNNNQYAGRFDTSGYGWRFFNNNTGVQSNTTLGVYTKGTGSQLNPLLVKNDGKVYTLDQEVDGNINLTTGHEFQINGVPLSGGMTPEQETELTNTTTKVDDLYDATLVTLNNIRFTNSVWQIGNFQNNTIPNIQDAMAVGQIPQDRITNLLTDLDAKRPLTNNTFNQLNLNGTTQSMTASGGTINATNYFTEFDLTGLVNTDLVVGIQETDIQNQTKCIFIKTEDPSNTNGNLIIRSSYILSDQDIILRKKGDCVFLHADWDSSRWKVLGVFSNVQQSLHVTENLSAGLNIICQQNLISNAAEATTITGFSSINLRTPDSGTVPTISIDGQEAFMTKTTTQTISGVKTFTNGIFSTQVSSKNDADLMLKTNDTDHKIDIANGANVGFTQTLTKTTLNRALNIAYASVPLGTSTDNKSPPTNSSSGDVYRDSANALFIVP